MQAAAAFAPAGAREAIDFTRPFIAGDLTPLHHTYTYQWLAPHIRLRYNQLHALYFNEQVAFFEQEMLTPALHALRRENSLPTPLANALPVFLEEEQRHTAMFRALNQRCAPEFYARANSYFVRIDKAASLLIRTMARRPRVFPLLIWLALLQEERSLHYSKLCLQIADALEPHFVAAHRKHLSDEAGHIHWDEQLLDWCWPQMRRAGRLLNAQLLTWMVREFFFLPKRSGRRVVQQLVFEFPQLDLRELAQGLRGLARDPAYLRTVYSRQIAPRTLARAERCREFAGLARILRANESLRATL
jgi:hypothetical protein